MNKSFKSLVCIGCIACAFTACNDDDKSDGTVNPNEGVVERIEDAAVQFRFAQTSPGTYATNSIDPATSDESLITGDVTIVVFDDNDVLEKNLPLSVTLDNTQAPNSTTEKYIYDSNDIINLSSGNKYIYAFANMPGTNIDPTGLSRTQFETKVLSTAINDMTQPKNFFIATLEPSVKTVNADPDNVQNITLQVGRLSAKVLLKDKKPSMENGMKGDFDFDNAEYRLINESRDYYLIGQSNPGIGVGGNYMNSPHFTANYDDLITNSWIAKASNPWTAGIAPGVPVYTKENTHTEPMNGQATSVQYKVKYIPDAADVYDMDGDPNATLTGNGTFWRAMAVNENNSQYYLFNADPTGKTIDGIGTIEDNSVVKYDEGFNYYVIPITDQDETVARAKYSVIRNHSYLLTLNTIRRLGSGTPDVIDPEIPIDQEYEILFTIEVLPWYKIEQGVDL